MQSQDIKGSASRGLGRGGSQAGAALVAVLLLTMVLSSIGLVAMRNTVHSMHMSGNYRLRSQAALTGDAALTFVSSRAGDRPASYVARMKATEDVGAARTTEASFDRGGWAEFSSNGYQVQDPTNRSSGELFANSTEETGLFVSSADATVRSHESDGAFGQGGFRVVMRDMVDGPPPVGSSSNKFCTKKIYFASDARYRGTQIQNSNGAAAENFSSWQRPVRAGRSMMALEGWVGPVSCGYGQ